MDKHDHFETLDPQNWDEMRKLAHQMVDDAFDQMQTRDERPAWQPLPDDVKATFREPLPHAPQAPESVYETYRETIMPYPMGNTHRRFWGWYMGQGTVMGALADFLAAVLNSNMGGGEHAAAYVEDQVVNWIKEMVGFPAESSGVLTSGGSAANFTGIAAAVNTKAGFDIRKHGVYGGEQRLVVYASPETHSCNLKSVQLLGLGSEQYRVVPANDDFTMNIDALRDAIAADRAAGHQPICVIGTSGTVNTGAIDDLNAIADICAAEGLWFHVDGAIGAVAVLAEQAQAQMAGIERADSVALDLHKWMHMPFDVGCVLVRDHDQHYRTFALNPDYVAARTRGLASGPKWFHNYGLQMSRSFRALKVWMTVKEHGADRFGRMIARNIEQAHYLGGLIERADDLELCAPVGLDIVCFRFCPPGIPDADLNEINKEILHQLQEGGSFVPSDTILNGVTCLRVAIASHRATYEDFDALVDETLRIGRQLAAATT